MPDGEYRALDDEIGTYSYDPVTRVILFEGGFFGRGREVPQRPEAPGRASGYA